MNGPLAPADPAAVGRDWLAAMRAGDYEAAWQATDRLEAPRRAMQASRGFTPQPHHLRWDGTPIDGRRVLVRCLHGLGDTLQFMRFVPAILRRARAVHFLVQPMLLGLLRGARGLGEVSNAWTDDPPPCDFEIEVMELAYVLRATPETLPPPYPHLAAQVRDRTPVEITVDGRLRVGLLWASSAWDDSRSVPLELLAPLARMPGVRCFSLQQEAAASGPALERLAIGNLAPRTTAIEDCAAAMLSMDVVISIDAMPAHLAATLGRPTWLLLKHKADWRWMDAREDTPWYPSMRLFRQGTPGDWDEVVARVVEALRLRVDAGSSPA